MPSSRFYVALVSSVLAAVLTAGCARQESQVHDHAAHAAHHHQAPHGGVLVELGEHAYNVELVLDRAAGKLTAYVLDGHAANFKRIAQSTIPLLVNVGAETRPLDLQARANAATGETVGDTAEFSGQADWLRTTGRVEGEIVSIEMGGAVFRGVPFTLAP